MFYHISLWIVWHKVQILINRINNKIQGSEKNLFCMKKGKGKFNN